MRINTLRFSSVISSLVILCLPFISVATYAQTASTSATLIFKNGIVLTMDDHQTQAQAVAIADNKIIAVGNNEAISTFANKHTKIIDLHGKTLLPGFIDAHIHPVMGALRLGKCSADDVATDIAQLSKKIVRSCDIKHLKNDQWLEVVNVNPSNFVATTKDLDKISKTRPVILFGTDGHTAWVNSVALQLSQITDQTPDPAGGHIERDAQGHATGFLIDDAQDFATNVMPKLSVAERAKRTRTALGLIQANGITSLQDAWAGPDTIEIYEALANNKQLTMRVRATIKSKIIDDEQEYQRLKNIRDHFQNHPLIRADAVKIFSDGVLEFPTQSAAMIHPYLDAKGQPTNNYGGRYFKTDVLNNYVARLDKEGFTVHVHSIGDYTTHAALDAFAYAKEHNGRNDNRHQITHLQIIDPADYARFAQLNVFADMQLYWAIPEEYSVDAVKPFINDDLFQHQYPAASLAKAGAVIAGASDWPVDASPDSLMPNTPLTAMQAAATRQNLNKHSKFYKQILNADERLDIPTMLAAYTINAARAIKADKSVGSIVVGKLADLVVLGANPLQSNVQKIGQISVQMTVFNGAIVYKK